MIHIILIYQKKNLIQLLNTMIINLSKEIKKEGIKTKRNNQENLINILENINIYRMKKLLFRTKMII